MLLGEKIKLTEGQYLKYLDFEEEHKKLQEKIDNLIVLQKVEHVTFWSKFLEEVTKHPNAFTDKIVVNKLTRELVCVN